jgi:hypothetical protein
MTEFTECPACGAPINPDSDAQSCTYCGVGLPRVKRPKTFSSPETAKVERPAFKPYISTPVQNPSADDFRRVSQRVVPWVTRLYNMFVLRRFIFGCLGFLVLFSILCACLIFASPFIWNNLQH